MNTKKHIVCAVLLCFAALLFADEYKLTNVPSEYKGAYIPARYEIMLNQTMNHFTALGSFKVEECHDFLLLQDDICYSCLKFHDGYAIKAAEFDQYRFVTNAVGMFIVDDKGNWYRKVSDDASYTAVYNYIVSVIFADALRLKNVSFDTKNAHVFIDGEEYRIGCDKMFYQTDDVVLMLHGKNDTYALKISGLGATMHKYVAAEDDHRKKCVDTVYKRFPLFYWNDAAYPDFYVEYLGKTDLRYLRNMVYAKHGYSFKNKELQSVFENFEWYKPNPAFSENDFTAGEKELLRKIQVAEAKAK